MMAAPREPLVCWLALIGLAVNIFIADGLVRSYGLLYLDFLDMYREGAFKTGWIATAFSLTTMSLSPLAGWVCDQFPLWQPLVAAALLGCAAMWACSLAPSLLVTIVTWGLMYGVSNALFFTASVSGTSKIFTYNRSLALGLLFAGGSIGGIAFPPISVQLTNLFGPRGIIRIYGGVLLNILISATLMWAHGRHQPSTKLQTEAHSQEEVKGISGNLGNTTHEVSIVEVNSLSKTKETEVTTSHSKSDEKCKNDSLQTDVKNGCCRSRFGAFVSLQFLSVCLYQFGIIFGFYGFIIYVPAYADDIGLSTSQGSLLLTMSGGADLAGRLIIGWLANLQCTNLYLLLISNLLTGAVMLVILSIFPGHVVLALTMVVLGLFLGGSTPMLGELVVDAVGADQAGTGIGIANMGFGIALSLYPLFTGAIQEKVGSYANVPHLSAAALVFAALAILIGRRCRPCRNRCCVSKTYDLNHQTISQSSSVHI